MMKIAKIILIAVIKDCRIFFGNYFYNGVIAGMVLAFVYSVILLYQFVRLQNTMKYSLWSVCMKIPLVALLGFYCYQVMGITLFSRSKGAMYILKLMPFSTWGADIWNLTIWIENIFMTIPLGILFYILWVPFRKIGWSMLAGFFFSLSIECAQLFMRLGKFETDDIMNNVFGTLLGFLICKGISRIGKIKR